MFATCSVCHSVWFFLSIIDYYGSLYMYIRVSNYHVCIIGNSHLCTRTCLYVCVLCQLFIHCIYLETRLSMSTMEDL